MERKWSEEAILRNRRKRMARRLYRDQPLFAVQQIRARFDCNYDEKCFFEDIPLKGNRKPKKIRGKRKTNGKKEYLIELKKKVVEALEENNQQLLNKIMCRYYLLETLKNKPWRLVVNFRNGSKIEYCFSPSIDAKKIKEFALQADQLARSGCLPEKVDILHDKICESNNFGG